MTEPSAITAAEVPDPTAVESTVLLDVREDDEWALGHAPGAQHIPMTDIPTRFEEIDPDADLYVVCRQGGRSARVAAYLEQVGYEPMVVVDGMVGWQVAGRPVVTDSGDAGSIF
ncbi:rhodanese-like domain-containing protein [Millisia brevis]|uniref:rhodanese-like domain-containing protein n=1 Tax=Millisia brevis TaxID=264148 RepID=UPI000834F676|nr:rhodanese-like domain-containing protein [Millisia brevis]